MQTPPLFLQVELENDGWG